MGVVCRWVHRYQHIYIWLLITFNNFKWFVNDIRSLRAGKYPYNTLSLIILFYFNE